MAREASKEEVARKRQQLIYARQRVVISGVTPEIAEGRYPIKRARDERVRVEADIFADSHDALSALLLGMRNPLCGSRAILAVVKGADETHPRAHRSYHQDGLWGSVSKGECPQCRRDRRFGDVIQ